MHLPAGLERPILILVSFLLLFFSYLLYSRTHELINSYKWVNHTNLVQLKLEQAFACLEKSESAQRGFMLTGDSAFLTPHYGSQQKADSLLAELKYLIKDNQQQQLNWVKLKYLMDYRFQRLTYSMKSFLANDDDLDIRLMLGRSIMDSIRHHMNVMKQVEITLLNEREKEKDRYVALTPATVLILSLLSFSILAFAYYRISFQLKLSKHYADQVSEKNKELALKNQQLQKSNEELHSFNYIASHDLREPLRKIRTFSSLVSKNDGLSPEAKQYLQRVDAIGKHMQSLLDDLLEYAKVHVDEPKLEDVDLNELIQKVQSNLKESLEESKATLRYENLPTIKGIRFQLEQLFENLITNSIKYKHPDKEPRIEIKSSEVASHEVPAQLAAHHQLIKIHFSDNGIGFNQKYADKVFELFQRLHTKGEYTGTGIGLTICRKIVDNHEGMITVQSQENAGTSFTIYLPA